MWITDKYIYAMLLIFPLFTGFYGYTQITASKYVLFSVLTVLWLLALLIGCLVCRNVPDIKHTGFPALLILIYLLLCCLSALFSSYGSSVLIGKGRYDGLVTTLLCVCIFFGVSEFARPRPGYVFAASISMSLNCAVAVIQLLGYNPLHLFPGNYSYYDAGVRFSSIFLGTIGNADLFSSFICLFLPLASVYYVAAERKHTWLLPAVLLGAFCIFVSGVSGGILALAVLIVAASPFVVTDGERLRRALDVAVLIALALFSAYSFRTAGSSGHLALSFVPGRRGAAVLAAAVCLLVLRLLLRKHEPGKRAVSRLAAGFSVSAVLAGFALSYFWRGTDGTIYEFSQVLHGNISDKFGSSRILIWKKVLGLVPGHLLFGGGPGTIAQRLDLTFTRFVAETGKTLSTYVDNAHNEYLGILANTGLASLISYLGAQILSLAGAIKKAGTSALGISIVCSLICYWVQAFFNLGLFLVSPLMWLVWGLLISSLSHAKS